MAVGGAGEVNGTLEAARAAAAAARTPAERAGAEHWRSYVAFHVAETTGRLEQLDEAISAVEASLHLTPPAAEEYAPRANDYGMYLRQRYDDRGNPGDLWKSVSSLRAAVDRTPPDDEDRPGRVMNLSNALTRLHELTDTRGVLDEAIEHLEDVVRAELPSVYERGKHLSALSRSLRIRGGDGDLERSVELDAEALAVTPEENPDRLRVLGNRANGLSRLSSGRDERWRQAVALWEQACRLGVDQQPALALTTALTWLQAGLTKHAPGDAVPAVGFARQALDRLVAVQAARRDQEQWLLLAQEHLPPLAAQVLVGAGDVESAVVAVDHTRAALLSQLLEQDRTGSRSFEELNDLARGSGPLVYLVPAAPGGVALLADGEGACALPLPGLTRAAVLDAVARLYGAYFSRDTDDRAWRETFDEVTRWLWDAAMGPVLAAAPGGRLNLLPGGLLAMLPLHAAWAPRPGSGRRYACDEALIALQPNAQLLMRARRHAAPAGGVRSVVAVADPQPSAERPLRWAVAEASSAAAAGALELLAREDATVEHVLDAMTGADVVHFACHGRADVEDGLAGGLVLADDRMLTVGDLLEHELQARLVVVSACESASVAPGLPDEVVGLASSLLSAGCKSVLASAFVVDDFSALVVAARFYAAWAAGASGLEAMREAVTFLRDTTNEEKLAWVAASRRAGATPPPVADALQGMLAFADPGERSFAHPIDWAPFVWWGSDARA